MSLKNLRGFIDGVVDFIISPSSNKFRWAKVAVISMIYAGGLFQWGRFINWGVGAFNFHDWTFITLPRLTFLKDAMEKGVLPLHTANTEALGGITTRFMAIPDVILSPQIVLLRWLSLGSFVVLQVILMYTLGFFGLLKLRKKYELSLLSFIILFILYNFNGYMLAHISVGHFTWAGAFLLSWFAVFVLELLEGKTGWRWVLKISLLLFVIFLQGSYHQYVWCLLFLVLLAIFSLRNLLQIAKGIVFSLLLSMVRVLPPFILLGKFNNQFIGGYRDTLTIINCLLHFQTPQSSPALESVSAGFRTWETTIFIGVIGTAFLFYFGIWRTLVDSDSSGIRKFILLPAICLAFLSLERIYQTIRVIFPLPLLTGERVSSRILGLAFVLVLVLAVIRFQAWLNQWKTSKITVVILVLLLLFEINDLWRNFIEWSVIKVASAFHTQGYTATQWYVANDLGDTPYILLIAIGFVITLLSLGFLVFMERKEHRSLSHQETSQIQPT